MQHQTINTVATTASSKRDARAGETFLLRLCTAANIPSNNIEDLVSLDDTSIVNAWGCVIFHLHSRRVQVRALRQIRHALLRRGNMGTHIIKILPNRIPLMCPGHARPDPLMRQRRIVEEDAIPGRITTPWIREMLLHILHHPTQGCIEKTNTFLITKPIHGGHRQPHTNASVWCIAFCGVLVY